MKKKNSLYLKVYAYNSIFGLLEVYLLLKLKFCAGCQAKYEHVLVSFKQKWSIFLKKKKKDL